MKRLFLLFLFSTCFSYSQEEHAWVYFKDKLNVQAALNNPSSILSSKSIERKLLRSTRIDARDVPVNETYVNIVKSQSNILVKAKSKWLNCVHVIGPDSAIRELQNLEFVSKIEFANDELNSRMTTENYDLKEKVENAIDFEYGLAANQIEMLNTNYLHENGFIGSGMTIAVIDAGFPNVNTLDAFSKMRAEGRLLGGYDFPNRSENFSNPSLDNHGILVLSTMSGFIENRFAGTAPDASFYLFRTEIGPTETPLEESYWVEAAERSDSLGVDLINTSLSYTLFDDPKYNYRPEEMDGETAFISRGANIATEKGILVVVSAGNRGDRNYFNTIGAPADANVLSVGAVDENRNPAFFSSFGPSADGRIKPDVSAQGVEIIAIDEFDNLVQINGTSFSAPILAGSIASFWQTAPNLSNAEVMQLVRQFSSLYSNPDNQLGYGIPDFGPTNLKLIQEEIKEPNNLDQLTIYPNPVKDILMFNNPTDQKFKITIFDTLGQVVFIKEQVQNKIDLSGFSRGVYIAMFEQNNSRQSFLIIKK